MSQHYPVNNILIVRTSAIGDVIMASPLIKSLKTKYPDAKISWLAEPFIHPLLADHPDVDSLLAFRKARFKQLWQQKKFKLLFSEMKQLKSELKQHNFDLAVDVQGLLKSGVWTWLSGAKRRVGFKSKEGSNWLMTEVVDKPLNHPDISSEYRLMAEYLACDVQNFFMDIQVSPETVTATNALLVDRQLKDYVVFSPFTTRPQKHWVVAYWRKLAELVFNQFGKKIVVIGGPADKDSAETLCENRKYMQHLCGETDIITSVEVINQASFLIGVDTGMTHAGIAKNTPTLALFGSTRPYLNTFVEQAKVLYLNKSCSPCKRKPKCGGSFHCLTDITPELVLNEMTLMMNQIQIRDVS